MNLQHGYNRFDPYFTSPPHDKPTIQEIYPRPLLQQAPRNFSTRMQMSQGGTRAKYCSGLWRNSPRIPSSTQRIAQMTEQQCQKVPDHKNKNLTRAGTPQNDNTTKNSIHIQQSGASLARSHRYNIPKFPHHKGSAVGDQIQTLDISNT